MKKSKEIVRENPCVYFIHCDYLKLIKIGVSINIDCRIKNIQHGFPYDLNLIGYINIPILNRVMNKGTLETIMHKKFKKERVKFEWFRDSIMKEVIQILQYYRENPLENEFEIERYNYIENSKSIRYENIISLRDVIEFIPPRVDGKKTTLSHVKEWISRNYYCSENTVKMESIVLKGNHVTSKEAVLRFFNHLYKPLGECDERRKFVCDPSLRRINMKVFVDNIFKDVS